MVGALFSPPNPQVLRINPKTCSSFSEGPVPVDRAAPLITPSSGTQGPLLPASHSARMAALGVRGHAAGCCPRSPGTQQTLSEPEPQQLVVPNMPGTDGLGAFWSFKGKGCVHTHTHLIDLIHHALPLPEPGSEQHIPSHLQMWPSPQTRDLVPARNTGCP